MIQESLSSYSRTVKCFEEVCFPQVENLQHVTARCVTSVIITNAFNANYYII